MESSRIASHSGGDSNTYSLEVVYHYSFDDRPYTSKRYNLSSGSSSGRTGKHAVVQRYSPGTETICFVNPKAPERAVLSRDWPWELAIFAGFSSIFLIVGTLGLLFAGRLTQSQSHSRSPLETVRQPHLPTGGLQVLKPKYTPVAKFVGILIGAIVWNGFIGGFVYLVFLSDDSRAPLFAKIIIGILALVGIGLVVGVCNNLLAHFNPRIRLTAQTTTVPLGGELHPTWTVSGRSGMLSKLRVIFEDREEATYRRGTSTSTDSKVFAEITVFETTEREFIPQGAARVVVPATLMHTLEASNNKILWRLRVIGEIPRWPDVDDDYPIHVLPQPAHR